MLTLDVRLSRVLDLTDKTLREALGATLDELLARYIQLQLLSGEAYAAVGSAGLRHQELHGTLRSERVTYTRACD